MSASSVSGVGQGSADKMGQRGSEHLFVGVEHLVGPRVVLAGSLAWSGSLPTGAGSVVKFAAPLDGIVSDYSIFLTPLMVTGGGFCAVSSVITAGLQIAGFVANQNTVATAGTMYYSVVRNTNATVQVN